MQYYLIRRSNKQEIEQLVSAYSVKSSRKTRKKKFQDDSMIKITADSKRKRERHRKAKKEIRRVDEVVLWGDVQSGLFKRKTIRRALHDIYRDIPSGSSIPRVEKLFIDVTKGSSEVYGELMQTGVGTMIKAAMISHNDIFVDLGCGMGKVVLQVALEARPQRAFGVELSSTRLLRAQKAVVRLPSAYIDRLHACGTTLLEGDILDQDLSSATIVYTCWTVFPKRVKKAIVKKLYKECHQLRYFIAQEPISWKQPYMELIKRKRVAVTWDTDRVRLYFYKIRVPEISLVK